MIKKILLLSFLLVTSIYSYTKWKAIGQGGGGNIVDILVHPTDPNIVWVETDLTGIFRSKDGGNNFERMSGAVEREEELFEWMRGLDHELVYDLSDPNIMYWAVDCGIYKEPGLYKSIDGGDNWFKLPNSPDLAAAAIVVDYNGVIYGVKHKKFYVSKDKGATWERKMDVPTYYCGDDYTWRRRFRIYMYTTKDNKIFIGDRREGTGIFYSTDMGESWHQVLKGKEIMDIACSPVTPDLVMALEQDGRIFRSTDGGENFGEVTKISHSYYTWGTWPEHYGSIAINNEDNVMAIGREELFISEDGGISYEVYKEEEVSWDPGDYIFENRSDNERLFKCNKLTYSPISNKWHFVDGMVIKTSADNGKSWKGTCKGVDIICVYSPPVIDITDPKTIHVAGGDIGHHYTNDLGKTWHATQITMDDAEGIAQDPNNPDIFYKMYDTYRKGTILKSVDKGVTWKKISEIKGIFHVPGYKNNERDSNYYNGWLGKIVVDPTNSSRVYACHRGSDGLYMSEDGGDSFNRILEMIHPWQLEVSKNGTVYICTWDAKGFYKSTDNGQSFTMINEGMVHDFAVHPDNDEIVYVNIGSFSNAWASARIVNPYEKSREHIKNGKGILYKTTNGGESWEMLGAYDGFAIYIEPNYPNVMLMSTREGGQGIMRSMDGGISWKSIHNNHNNYHPRGFVYGGIPGRVYSWNHNMERIDNIHIEEFEND